MTRGRMAFALALRPMTHVFASRAIVGRCRSPATPGAGRFARTEVRALVRRAWRIFAARPVDLPTQHTVGGRLLIEYAGFTLALFQALLEHGIERARAIELVSDMTWRLYAIWGVWLRLRRGRGLTARFGDLPSGVTVPLAFPFNPPSFVAIWKRADTGVRYDMVRCPLAEYFRTHGAVDLCVASACDLDFALAEQQGLTLTREQTLAEGHQRCTFWSGALGAIVRGRRPRARYQRIDPLTRRSYASWPGPSSSAARLGSTDRVQTGCPAPRNETRGDVGGLSHGGRGRCASRRVRRRRVH